MLTSIITVVFNGEITLEDTIISVLQQTKTFTDIEYIIIDGASTDSTVKIIEKYRIIFEERGIYYKWISQPDTGIFDAMNRGLELSKSEWVIFMNSGDMFYSPEILDSVFAQDLSPYNLIYGDVELYDDNDVYQFKSRTNKYKINLNAVCHQSVFIRRLGHPHFNLKYKLAADHDIIYDYIKEGNVLYIPVIISRILIGGASSDLKRTRKEKLEISLKKGKTIDHVLAFTIFGYNFLKGNLKNMLLRFFPKELFKVIRNFKNKVEQL